MNNCAVDYPEDISEFDVAKLSRAKCKRVNVCRILEAPIAFECRRTLILQLNETRDLAIGEILYMHARDGIIDPQTMNLNLSKYNIIGRLFGNLYAPIRETFPLTRLDHSEWLKKFKS
jgi:flavin reductase (DIM6/NTAB) family NADH-FMN oxidoreductase RutF